MARANSKSRLDLHDALSQQAYNNAVLCTYTFDPLFFENYCLERFAALKGNNNISVCTDRATYQKIVLAPEAQRAKRLNLRYLLSQIETKGRFHPKLFLFTTATSGRLIIGSANFTEPGLAWNAELVDVFDFELDEQEGSLPLFQDVFAFVSALAEGWPVESLASNLRELRSSTPWLVEHSDSAMRPVRLLHNLESPLWGQIVAFIPRPVERIHVVSPFFDTSPALIDRVLQDYDPERLYLYTQNRVTTMTSDWLHHSAIRSNRAEILLCSYEDDGHPQQLHAKAIIFESRETRVLVYGSANFTTPALLTHGKAGNIETVVLVPNISRNSLNPGRFCDPSESAVKLQSSDQLLSASRDREDYLPARPVHLIEAVLANEKLMMRANIPSDIGLKGVALRLHFQGSRGEVVPIRRISEGRFSAALSDESVSRLQEFSTPASLETILGKEQLSNLVFVTNLLDIRTLSSVRNERQFRDAMESAEQFFSVLDDLLRAGDNAALLTFLNFCDIPLLNAPRPPALRNRAAWEGQEGMRTLGERNLEICKTLHDATLKFFERHLKKLKRHTESLALDGVSNFLHIFLSMGRLLRMQVERLVIALEEMPGDVSPREWSECRELWDVYFLKFRELMECLWDDYIEPLGSEFTREDIHQEFGQDQDAIHELCDAMILYRERIEKVRHSKCVLSDPIGRKTPYPYFRSVLEPESWQRYVVMVQQRQRSIDYAVLGHVGHQVPTFDAHARN